MLAEEEGCRILAEVFAARGIVVERDIPFSEGGVAFDIDGWNAERRIGFEYRTSEADDKDDLSLSEIELLAERMEAGELFIFVIDETSVEGEAELRVYANAFLDEVERRVAHATTSTTKKPKVQR